MIHMPGSSHLPGNSSPPASPAKVLAAGLWPWAQGWVYHRLPPGWNLIDSGAGDVNLAQGPISPPLLRPLQGQPSQGGSFVRLFPRVVGSWCQSLAGDSPQGDGEQAGLGRASLHLRCWPDSSCQPVRRCRAQIGIGGVHSGPRWSGPHSAWGLVIAIDQAGELTPGIGAWVVAMCTHRMPSAFAWVAPHSALHSAWWEGFLVSLQSDNCWVGQENCFHCAGHLAIS